MLESVSENGIALRVQHASPVKGRPPKLDAEPTPISFGDIQSTRTIITFK
jgi:hypothetical protein